MAYAFVRTHAIDIGGSVYYMFASRSFTYRFNVTEEYDPAANRSRLTLSSSQVQFSVNDSGNVYGVVRLGGTEVAAYAGVGVTTPGGAAFATIGGGGAVLVDHDALGAGPSVTLGFAQAPGTPNTIGSNFGFSPENGVVVGFSVGTTRTISLASHPRASSIASSSAAVKTRESYLLSVTRNAPSFYHKASFRLGGALLYTSEPFETSLNVTIPRSWFASRPNDTALSVSVGVQTYADAGCTTAVGDPAATSVTVTADEEMKPALSPGWAALSPCNTGAAAGITGYVRGYSRAEAAFDASKVDMSAAAGASLASFSVVCQGQSVTASPYRTGVLTAVSVPVVCTVTDSRGRSASEVFTLAVMDYAAPSLSGIGIYRCGADLTADEEGLYIRAGASVSVSPLNAQNSVTLSAAIAAAGGGYGAETALVSGTASRLGPVSADASYTVRVTATDALGSTAVYYQKIPTRRWAMKFRANGSGAAFGKAAEFDHCLEISPDWSVKSQGIADLIYPVGSVYLASGIADPAAGFGGSWSKIDTTSQYDVWLRTQ